MKSPAPFDVGLILLYHLRGRKGAKYVSTLCILLSFYYIMYRYFRMVETICLVVRSGLRH